MTRILRNVELRELVLDPAAKPGPGCSPPTVVTSAMAPSDPEVVAAVESAEGLRPLSLHGDEGDGGG